MGAAIEEGIKRVSLELSPMQPENRGAEVASKEPSDDAEDVVALPMMGSVTIEDDTVNLTDPREDIALPVMGSVSSTDDAKSVQEPGECLADKPSPTSLENPTVDAIAGLDAAMLADVEACGLSREELLQVAKDDPELYRLLRGQGAPTPPASPGGQQGKGEADTKPESPVVQV